MIAPFFRACSGPGASRCDPFLGSKGRHANRCDPFLVREDAASRNGEAGLRPAEPKRGKVWKPSQGFHLNDLR